MSEPFVVVGADAAGLSAASKFRREDGDRDVIVFEKGAWVSFSHCGMPYYVKGEVEDLTDLLTLRPEEVRERGVDLRRGHEVVGVDVDAKTVTVDGPDGTDEQPYGDLLIATGARATTGPFEEALALDGAFTLHDMDSAAAMRAFLAAPGEIDPEAVDDEYVDRERVRHNAALAPPETAAIVGGGYVGVEVAEALSTRGVDVHLFQRPEDLLVPFGRDVGDAIAAEVADECREHGVAIHTDTHVSGVVGEGGRVAAVEYENGGAAPERRGAGSVDVDMCVVGIGVEPNVEFLPEAVDRGDSGALAVDEYGRTSAADVYAAGDCAEAEHAVTGEPAWVPLGLTANRAGRAVGSTAAGDPTTVGTIAGTAVVKAFDLGCGRTGIVDEERARKRGFDPVSVTITASSRSGYYPGSEDTTVTLVGDRDSGRVLGGATVGKDRAAKRIDPVAMAVQDGLTVAELQRRDLGYAPPFSPVWDPVLTAAKVLAGEL